MSFGKLLARQLLKLGINPEQPPTKAEDWRKLLETINKSYTEFENHQNLSDNMVDVTMQEMARLNDIIQKNADEKIQSSEEKLSHVIEAVPSLVAWTDASGIILGCNEMLASTLEVIESSILGKDFTTLGWEHLNSNIQSFFKSSDHEFSSDFEFGNEKNKKYFKLFFRKFAQNKMMVLVGIDLTEERKKQAELDSARATSLASSRLALLGDMASGIAHEINNPLAIILSHATLMERSLVKMKYDEIPKRLEKIQSTTLRISKIISGLKYFARDGFNDPFEITSVKKIIDETLDLASEKIKSLAIEIRYDQNTEDCFINCRPSQISQVLLNLINNSRDAIAKDPAKWIEITLVNKNEMVVLSVTDSGTGIPLNIQEKLFSPFFTTKEVGKGTGLGLSSALGIIQSHQGQISIDNSCPNTRFIITLPLAQTTQQAA